MRRIPRFLRVSRASSGVCACSSSQRARRCRVSRRYVSRRRRRQRYVKRTVGPVTCRRPPDVVRTTAFYIRRATVAFRRPRANVNAPPFTAATENTTGIMDDDTADGPAAGRATSQSFKVVLLGEGCVGKTSLVLRYTEDKFTDKHVSTLQVRRPRRDGCYVYGCQHGGVHHPKSFSPLTGVVCQEKTQPQRATCKPGHMGHGRTRTVPRPGPDLLSNVQRRDTRL